MGIKLVIFDIGGVLVKKNDDFKNHLALFADKYGCTGEFALKAFYKNFDDYHFNRTLSQYNFWKGFLKELGVDMTDEDFEYIFDLFNNKMQTEENDEIVSIVKNLAKNGYKLSILSHSIRDMDLQIYCSNYLRYFDRVCLSHMNSKKKDVPESFKDVLDAFEVKPGETLFIDDKEKNIVVPKEMGIHTFLYNSEEYLKLLDKLQELDIKIN